MTIRGDVALGALVVAVLGGCGTSGASSSNEAGAEDGGAGVSSGSSGSSGSSSGAGAGSSGGVSGGSSTGGSSGSSGAGGSSGSSGGGFQTDSGIRDGGADGAQGAGSGVQCGSEVEGGVASRCGAGESCCLENTNGEVLFNNGVWTYTCQASSASCTCASPCYAIRLPCARNADCPGGQVCCVTIPNDVGLTTVACVSGAGCMLDSGTPSTYQVCDLDAPDCPAPLHCRPETLSALTGYGVCTAH